MKSGRGRAHTPRRVPAPWISSSMGGTLGFLPLPLTTRSLAHAVSSEAAPGLSRHVRGCWKLGPWAPPRRPDLTELRRGCLSAQRRPIPTLARRPTRVILVYGRMGFAVSRFSQSQSPPATSFMRTQRRLLIVIAHTGADGCRLSSKTKRSLWTPGADRST